MNADGIFVKGSGANSVSDTEAVSALLSSMEANLARLDQLGLSMAAIHLSHAIEQARASLSEMPDEPGCPPL